MAISDVGKSRISPTMMTSGSWRKNAQARGKGEVDLLVHCDLRNTVKLVLDRILDGQDVEIRRIDLGQTRIQRRRLARTGGPRDQQNAVRPRDEIVHRLEVIFAKTDVCQIVQDGLAIKQTNGNALAAFHRRRRGDTHVDVLAGDLAADA